MNTILITMDTLRADKIGALTPTINKLSENAYIFENAIAQSTTTDTSHCSILTGTQPFTHGVRKIGWVFDGKVKTLAEIMKQNGYNTVGAVSVEHLSDFFGVNKGFDTYFNNHYLDHLCHKHGGYRIPNSIPKIGGKKIVGLLRAIGIYPQTHQRPGSKTNKVLFKWLNENHNKQFFMWIHYFDVHRPYMRSRDYLEMKRDTTYDERVKIGDDNVKQVVEKLKELGIFEDTMIVITSDHGEALGEHNHTGHGEGPLYDEELRIPLIFSKPDFEQKVFKSQVRSIDIMPTILGLSNINAGDFEGVDLLNDKYPEYSYSELYPKTRCLRTDTWKLILTKGKEKELYNLKEDPEEKKNLYLKEEKIAEKYETILKKMETKTKEQKVEDHIKKALRDLGYY